MSKYTLRCAPLGLALDNTTLRIAVGLRLGAPLYHPYVCVCGEPVDNLATHGLSCIKKGETYSRHFALNNIIKRACAKIHVPTLLEPLNMFRTDGKRAEMAYPDALVEGKEPILGYCLRRHSV
jgi:hypothetical protein